MLLLRRCTSSRTTFSTGQNAPSLIQVVKLLICPSVRRVPPFGIFSAPLCRIAVISRLLSGSPGTTAGPDLPPARMSSRESRRRPPHFRIRVAGKTLLRQNRTDARFEEIFGVRDRSCSRRDGCGVGQYAPSLIHVREVSDLHRRERRAALRHLQIAPV